MDRGLVFAKSNNELAWGPEKEVSIYVHLSLDLF